MTEGHNAEEKYFAEKDRELLDALIHQTVWVLKWNTASCDHGLIGAWFHRPTEKEQEAFMRKTFPDEFGDETTVDWTVQEFDIKERIAD